MDCREIQEQLSAFLDKELGEELHLLINRHLASCPACRAELAAWERLEAALGELEVPTPQGVAAGVRRRLRRPGSSWHQSLALAACLVLGIFLGGSLTGTLYQESGSAVSNGNGNEVASLEIFHDHPQGSLGGAFSYQGEEENGA
jgi:anti-sigma factor RsiW